MVYIRIAVSRQDLKTIALQEPVHLLAQSSERDRESRQWPIAWQVDQLF